MSVTRMVSVPRGKRLSSAARPVAVWPLDRSSDPGVRSSVRNRGRKSRRSSGAPACPAGGGRCDHRSRSDRPARSRCRRGANAGGGGGGGGGRHLQRPQGLAGAVPQVVDVAVEVATEEVGAVPVLVPGRARPAPAGAGRDPTPQPTGVHPDQRSVRQRCRLRPLRVVGAAAHQHHPIEIDGDAVGDHDLDTAHDRPGGHLHHLLVDHGLAQIDLDVAPERERRDPARCPPPSPRPGAAHDGDESPPRSRWRCVVSREGTGAAGAGPRRDVAGGRGSADVHLLAAGPPAPPRGHAGCGRRTRGPPGRRTRRASGALRPCAG